MKKNILLMVLPFVAVPFFLQAQQASIYNEDWIDFNKNGKKDIYEDPKQPIESRITDLIGQMNTDEKTCQMVTLYGFGRVLKDELPTPQWKQSLWKDGIANIDEHLNSLPYNKKAVTQYSFPQSKHANAINTVQRWFVEETRLGIPVDFTNEGIHGLNHDHATLLPAPIAIGSTWNKELVYRAGKVVGREAAATGYTNVYAPILDLARDPRWGRVVECYGEDPFHIAELGKQMALGIQHQGVASTIKHFAAYSMPKGGRDGDARTDPHIAPRELHQLHLYPFRRVVQEAHVLGVMSSYNDYDGVPVSGSRYFLTDLLRQQYGFNGYVVSDSRAVEFLYKKHMVAGDYKEAIRQVVEAGLDVRTDFTKPEDYVLPLRELIREGRLSMQTIDQRVASVLRVKFKLGLFDHPFVSNPAAADTIVFDTEARAMQEQLSREVLVLLKNDNNTLPLDASRIKNILVTGPLAAETNHSISRYGPSNVHVISVLEGLQQYADNRFKVQYAKGCNITDPNWPESEILPTPITRSEQASIDEAVSLAKRSDAIVIALGEDEKMVGESKTRTGLDLPARQLQLLQAMQATGKPVILVLINGRPLSINWAQKYTPAIIEAWFPGATGGKAIAESIFGDYNPGGKLAVTFPKTTGQLELNFPYKPGSHAGQPGDGPNGYGKTAVNGPLYPFGHGLSYTQFAYSDLSISPDSLRAQSNITVQVTITNSGKRKGDEVVQLYLKDKISSVTQYETLLRGFERISLQPGESKTVSFYLRPDDLALLDKDMNWTVEPGEFEIQIGSSSTDIRLRKTFTVR
ncbi:glycoside hydrolase family 3 N-terminal domain-containing protein [Pseudobacter ginsenosidimutans]|uniref:Beta-glucosidase n=1 Tax=Pseudobacter ginsenosidimutans TaxID=661488 RepID=A0A4Q7N3A7_9BACT|nr:glycoside hydrolase family 3 N-terminal domain-containing protein [Pseudobacter ginsenosidimutans]RZS74818.1 beta-glucosidase [Pseudobacter ginsenosidimutans]